ncbi:uncharacterized protein K460DRAFT_338753 [Cucurbitaria berberidis CBS 394.84]|uniref:Uncharacterized protein n=1 Tax=Cucurbitaria berberidis CBS 394.84 TaxID=1168544 RepID=A0A9P4L930_9PLEO|nr:uncharacterized protein K460DRAFT_338753 [Cucurbitaria berberidis CBS 394.84]KAF1845962.1 hypothetical protein K460DRAFT_338753 [Cucurbitaria berberidis CBS 394.84]
MAPTTTSPRLSRISIFYLITSAITSVNASVLFHRQAPTCGGNQNLQQCGTGFPSSFCCPKDTTCMSLNSPSVQSVICCPSGQDCAFIQTITCDINQLNATLHPDNQMHLAETNGVDLPKCGDKCCPLGYTCKGGMCSKDSTTSPSASASPTSITGPTSSATNPASASQTSNCPVAAPIQTSQGFDGRSFAAGFFPGIVLGALSTIGLIWAIKKRRESQAKARYSGDFGHVARQISDPIYDPMHAARTDFMRRGSQSAQPSPNSTDKIITGMKNNGAATAGGAGLTPRIKSMWDRTPKLNFGFATGLPANPAPPPPAVRAGNNNVDPYTTPRQTPRRKHSKHSSRHTSSSHRHHRHHDDNRLEPTRSGSQETIDVLMPAPGFLEPPKPPGMRENRFTSDSSNTTFTKLMERAGFDERGQQEVRDYRAPR